MVIVPSDRLFSRQYFCMRDKLSHLIICQQTGLVCLGLYINWGLIPGLLGLNWVWSTFWSCNSVATEFKLTHIQQSVLMPVGSPCIQKPMKWSWIWTESNTSGYLSSHCTAEHLCLVAHNYITASVPYVTHTVICAQLTVQFKCIKTGWRWTWW